MNPYFKTPITGYYLDIINMPILSKSKSDKEYIIEKKYEFNPALLSFDLYGTTSYWWVFIRRNMDKLEDPIFDFKAGVKLYIPSKLSIQNIA